MSNQTEQQIKSEYSKSVRSIVFLATILKFNLNDHKQLVATSSKEKNAANSVIRSIDAHIGEVMMKYKPEQWDKVRCSLRREQMHDINVLLDMASEMNNVGELVDVLNTIPKEFVLQ